MGLVQNLKKTLNNLGDKILVELSYLYIKQLAKQTSKKQDNSLLMEFLQNPLTPESQHTTIATSSADTSEKIIMTETEDIVLNVRDWVIDRVESFNGKDIDEIHNQMALIDEFYEWLDLKPEQLEVLSIDEIKQE